METKISIVTISYNAREYIAQTIESVISQSYKNIEYVVIDGGSTDGTAEVVRAYSPYIDYFISEKDDGISDAFNKGINACTGELVFLLSADDFLQDDALHRVVRIFNQYQPDVIHGSILMLNPESGNLVRSKPIPGLKNPYFGQPLKHGATFVTKKAYEKVGGYNTKYKYAMDYDMTLKLLEAGMVFQYLDIDVATIRAGGVNHIYRRETIEECRQITIAHGTHRIFAWLYKEWKLFKLKVNNVPLFRSIYVGLRNRG